MNKRVIIGFTGLIGSGKSTAADYLVEEYDFRKIKFAGPLKDMCRAFGLTNDHIEGHLKEQPCKLLGGRTPRYFMQALGTEFGRNLIDQNLWINAWLHAVEQVPEGVPVVCDDCRFPNEADAIYKAGSVGRVCRITRTSAQTEGGHVSELQAFKADSTIENNGTAEELYKKLDTLASRLKRTASFR